MNKRAVITLSILCVAFSLRAEPDVLDYLSPERQSVLLSEGIITAKPQSVDGLELVPPPLRDSVTGALQELAPDVLTETLIYVESRDVEGALLFLVNELLKVDELVNVTYRDEKRKRNRQVFEESWRVASANSREPIGNLSLDFIPESLEFFTYQNMPPLGSVVMKYRLQNRESGVEMIAVSATPMKTAFITSVKEEKLHLRVSVTTFDEGFLVYAAGAAAVFNPGGLASLFYQEFYYRIDALFAWYKSDILLRLQEWEASL